MKAYKVELLIVDHDNVGLDGIKEVIEDTKYPNYCISPNIMDIEEKDIGEWHDDHPLNLLSKMESEYKKLFKK